MHPNLCLVSIVTISKNNLSGLYKTLNSVKEQDYVTIEHIVIDGNSNDGTKELLETYSHSKTFIYSSEPDTGISNAFNKGLDKSNGNLIFFLNSGDIFYSKNVIHEVVKSYLQDKWKCGVGSTVSSNYKGNEVFYNPPQLKSNFLKYFMFLPHQGIFCETSLHKKYKFNEQIKISMDYEVFIRMLPNIQIFYLPIVVSKCEPNGVASNSKKRIAEQSIIRAKHAKNIYEMIIVSIVNFVITLKDMLKINSPFTQKNQ
jgi:putative colanic acid biosynthesis glycosyltransferase